MCLWVCVPMGGCVCLCVVCVCVVVCVSVGGCACVCAVLWHVCCLGPRVQQGLSLCWLVGWLSVWLCGGAGAALVQNC